MKKKIGCLGWSAVIALWFISVMLMAELGKFMWGETSNGTSNFPSWYTLFEILIPTAISYTLFHLLKSSSKKPFAPQSSIENGSDGRFSVGDLEQKASLYISWYNDEDDISAFISWYDKAISALEALKEYDGKDILTVHKYPALELRKMQDEFQWHLCDAIVRAKEKAIGEIKEKYKNSKEFQRKTALSFINDIEDIRPRMSAGTSELADNAVDEISRLIGLGNTKRPNYDSKNDALSILNEVDMMEGHQFEHWCADLLRKSGFLNVEVTPGSGDQGVDVIAEKDGIQYAIQCKCYSHDLGNSPIQEVNTGKSIYRCQIGVVMTNRYFTSGAKQAAEATGVLLWDRDRLMKMIEAAQ